ncbi:hypothetical protein GCM10027449_27120 [Sinomonas notoginsengisoli]|uniref:DUF4097 family beta strand repeat-containing protein n=1 Tax=Sinomonas notoginsengisoli TaxID=1457311 RepID=UPI0027E199B8|nr:DUF4097 family beta strand repeat-containing protein [Sinomonas notoginsengisoli]
MVRDGPADHRHRGRPLAAVVEGRLDVIAHDGAGARVEVSEVRGDPVTVTLTDGRLEVRHREDGAQGWFRSLMNTASGSSLNYAVVGIAVPRGTSVEIATVTGEGFVSGGGPSTRINTVSGSLLADGTEGELHLNTVSGEIIARGHTGILTAKTVSGEITASGALADIRAKSVSGDLSFDVTGSCRSVGASTMSGDLTVRVPYDLGVDLAASMVSGRVVVDDERFRASGGKVTAVLGPSDRRVAMRVKSVSGDISVLHAPAGTHPEPGRADGDTLRSEDTEGEDR